MNLKRFSTAMCLAALAGLIGGLSHWFIQGRARAETAGTVKVSELRLVDETGRTRALLSILRGKPSLILIDEKGEFRLELSLGESGEPNIFLRDQDGQPRMKAALSPMGLPEFRLLDHEGKARADFGLGADGSPFMLMRDGTGKERLALWQEKKDTGLALADPEGRPRVQLVLKGDEKPSLAFFGPDQKAFWYAPQ